MSRFFNRTRRSPSILHRLIREKRLHLAPLYCILLTSELAREGIANSGSYRFADHIYGNRPKGRYGIGWLVDAVLLNLVSAKSFRSRYLFAKREIHRLVAAHACQREALHILSVPCGLAREMFETAEELRRADFPYRERIRWHGIDLDPDVVNAVMARARRAGDAMEFWTGDALHPHTYRRQYDVIVSLGFTEFLDDGRAVEFYSMARRHLTPGGTLVTSGMIPHRLSDYLMRTLAEIHAFYRDRRTLEHLAQQAGFRSVATYHDTHGLQTMVIAVKE